MHNNEILRLTQSMVGQKYMHMVLTENFRESQLKIGGNDAVNLE